MKTDLRIFGRITGALLATLSVVSFSNDAHALGPIDIEVGAKVGYGANPIANPPVTTNPLGVGIGARAGVSLLGLYAGVNLVDYLGGSGSVIGVNYSVSALEYGVEVGYGIKVLMLTLRPQVGLGNLAFSTSPTLQGVSTVYNQSTFYLEPGLTALLTFGILYFGADGNALVATSSGYSAAFTAHGQVGITF